VCKNIETVVFFPFSLTIKLILKCNHMVKVLVGRYQVLLIKCIMEFKFKKIAGFHIREVCYIDNHWIKINQ